MNNNIIYFNIIIVFKNAISQRSNETSRINYAKYRLSIYKNQHTLLTISFIPSCH